MVWKSVFGVLAIVAGAIIVSALRHRHRHEPGLGAVSTNWIAEHQSGVDV